MDTGVDIPEIVNLVFFKRVLSRIKFDQMWGRGTRTCKDLHVISPSRDYFEGRSSDDTRMDYCDKQGFFIFDYCNNFEYFDRNPEGKDPSNQLNLNQKIYSTKLDILTKLQPITYQEQPSYKAYHTQLKQYLANKIANLDTDRIDVNAKLYYVDKYKAETAFEYLSEKDLYDIKTNLLKLIDQDTNDDTYSKSLEFRVCIMQLSLLDDKIDSTKQQIQLMKTAMALLAKASIKEIFDKKEMLKELSSEDYYQNLDFFELEKIKSEIGPLIKYLRGDKVALTVTNFNDVVETTVRDVKFDFDDFRSYREKIISYLLKHFGEIRVVQKIINLEALTQKDLNELQDVLNSLKNPVDDETENFNNTQELIIFIRKIIGLDKKAIDEKCAKFLNYNNFNQEQRQLINLIIDFAIRNGNVTTDDLVNEQPFCDLEIQELFDFDIRPLIQLVNVFNSPLTISAAA